MGSIRPLSLADRQAGVLKLKCFKSRFLEEFSITLRPDLSDTGDFTVTDAPDVTTERLCAEMLTQAIRTNPGQTQNDLINASGV